MEKRNILITGGAGFIGSHMVELMTTKYPHYHIVTLDKLTYAGSLDNIAEAMKRPNHTFIEGDICDKELAHSFRFDLLAQGGQKPGMEMYRKFRGADPDKAAMLKARGLWQEPVVEEPVVEEVELNEPAAVRPAFTPERKPVMRPGKPGEPIRSDIAKKPIKK
mgnify:CR=1 FL=1